MFNLRNDLAESQEFMLLGLSILDKNQKTNLMPELMQILTPKQIVVLLQIYGGKTVKFPTTKDFSTALKAALYVYQTKFLNHSEETVQNDLDVSDAEFKEIMDVIADWSKELQNQPGQSMFACIRKV